MSKYKVGDKVFVRSDLLVHKNYDGWCFTLPMAQFLGQIVTIKSVEESGNYRIVEFPCVWTNSMFEDTELCEPVSIDISCLL